MQHGWDHVVVSPHGSEGEREKLSVFIASIRLYEIIISKTRKNSVELFMRLFHDFHRAAQPHRRRLGCAPRAS